MPKLKLPIAGDSVAPEYLARLAEIERLAVLFDCRYRIPWTRVHFGIDPIVGLVPILGDLVMATASIRLVVLSRGLGVSSRCTAKMALNVVIDLLIGLVPLAGPAMDLFFRANLRNLDLLLKEIERARAQPGE